MRLPRIGVNAAVYVGHSSVRRRVMGEAASEREASEDELRAILRVEPRLLHALALHLGRGIETGEVENSGCEIDQADQRHRHVEGAGDLPAVGALTTAAQQQELDLERQKKRNAPVQNASSQ